MITRMTWTGLVVFGLMVDLIFTSACNRYKVIPEQLKGRVNHNVTFEQIKASPSDYQGDLVVWGGEVLSATRLEEKTQIEVLQLPLTDEYTPTMERAESKGRFLAFDGGREIIDPAILKEGTPVTIIGEIQSPQIGSLGESRYEFPTLVIRDMTVWDQKSQLVRPYPYYGYYYGYGWRPYYFLSGTRVRS